MEEMNYDSMGKEALRAECRDREISYSKLNNDGMRAALRADDAAHADFGKDRDEFEMTQAELDAQKLRPTEQVEEPTLSAEDRAQIAAEVLSRNRAPQPPQQNTPAAPTPARATRAGLKIESNREERHGVKRPSAGGVCRAVWDFCDELQAAGGATAKQVREAAPSRGWNPNNAMIEFYQWRKFNGIVGRVAK